MKHQTNKAPAMAPVTSAPTGCIRSEPAQLPGYATNIEGVARAARFMQAGGYVGIGLATGAQLCESMKSVAQEPTKSAGR